MRCQQSFNSILFTFIQNFELNILIRERERESFNTNIKMEKDELELENLNFKFGANFSEKIWTETNCWFYRSMQMVRRDDGEKTSHLSPKVEISSKKIRLQKKLLATFKILLQNSSSVATVETYYF